MDLVLPDLILYSTIVILSMLGLYTVDIVAEKYKKLNQISLISFGIVLFVSGFVPYYHWFYDGNRFRAAYSSHLILACYLFLSIDNLWMATGVGVTVSLLHLLTLYFVTYSNDSITWRKVSAIKLKASISVLG